ncbi:fungal-specific transcription factor domain-domain-containing protein [Aspergillus taichungensis]|uniref:Fungal-specific transcription factor domain-domain-containing protein n=1 Tax=Aspergillus taichungensis TaxID=482145 RepID=A0A2J5I3D3_9EURO|nr:fungal-specific transcription factor domain-domain-containing protein [Aspergillus taichungensis]
MTGDTRHTARGSSRSKRRLTGDDDSGKPNRAADDSVSNPKRQRVSRACDSCRSKKDKCDGVKPVCSTCASLSRPCTYKANPKKRGLPTGYIRSLELLWGLVFCKIQGSEDVVRTLLKTANIPSHLASMGKETEASDTLLSSFKNSAMLKDIEKMILSLEQPEEDLDKGDHVSREDDSPSDAGSSALSSNALEWHLPQTQVYGGEALTTVGLSPARTPSTTSTARLPPPLTYRDCGSQTMDTEVMIDAPSQPSSLRADRRTTLKLPSNVWPLLDIYFSYTQCWFPILEKHDILRTAFRHSEDDAPVDPSSPGSGNYAALWAALALASVQETSTSETGARSRMDCNVLYATAKSLIPDESDAYEIGHVQALLILSLVKLGQNKWMTSWILVGQAVRVARFSGLDFPQGQSASRDSKASPRTKHVLLGCFVLETLISMQTGQIPSMRKDDVTKIGLINEDGLEEWHPWEDQTGLRSGEPSRGSFHRGPLLALSTFNRLVSLMCILNEFCCLRQNPIAPSQELEALQRQLQQWTSALSKSYRVDLQNSAKMGSPHIFGLEMMHESVATMLSTHVALQRRDGNGLESSYTKRATEGSRRLLSLLEAYVENYSLAATCPTFEMILGFGKLQTTLLSEAEPELRRELQAFLLRLSAVWAASESSIPRLTSDQPPISETMALTGIREESHSHVHSNNSITIPQTTNSTSINVSRGARMTDESRRELTTPESLIANLWMRTPSNTEGNIPLSLSTPTPSLNTHGSPKESRHRASLSGKPSNETPMTIPDTTPQFHKNGPQYPTPFTEPNLNLDAFVGVDSYGLQRQRIAPDLDALFDELASLDGTEHADNQPEFMQNLGFVPDAGIPEFYPYTHQVDPS